MVMETPPSPQWVGREFVRQYYTLLNAAPAHLHRFYNNSSSFIHGGSDPHNRDTAVVGQKQIHQRIQQLNFRDCHAKINQVDSQATLGNGVVVQVAGELSNGGQPMRRFTQTFVLAAQSPKKYYVHNDIFRYQDMLTADEELEAEMTRSEAEEDHEGEQIQPKNDMHKSEGPGNVGYYGGVNQVVNGTSEPVTRELPTAPPVISAPVHEPPHQTTIPMNSLDIMQQPAAMNSEPGQVQGVTQNDGYSAPEDPPPVSQEPQETTQTFHQQPIVESVNEPKTYATLVKSGGGQISGSGAVFYNNNVPATPPQNHPKSSSPPPGGLKNDNRLIDNKGLQSGPKPARSNDTPQRNNFQQSRPQTNDDNGNYGSGADGDRRRPNTQYSDNHQLFMGNLPHTATEPELRELFGKFGNIVDLRILSKPGGKGTSGAARVPNYGFIIFDDVTSVQAVLSAKPILFPGENGVKLNVEEKKAKNRSGGGGGGGGGGGDGGRGGPRGGPMRMGGMGGGPPRSGRGGATSMQRFNPNNARR